METNLTLNVGYFSGPASLNTGEIVGISITIILVVMILLVIVAVLVLKVRPGSLAREKEMSGVSGPLELSYSPGPQHCQTALAGQNGSVVINGTTYTQTSATSGLANGYTNPDVIPNMSSPQGPADIDQALEEVQNRLNTSTAGANRYQNLPLPVTSVGVEAAFNTLPYSQQRENYPVLGNPGLGAVNDCFSEESVEEREGRSLYSQYYAPHLGSTSPFYHGTVPRNLSHLSHSWISSPLRLPDWREQELSYPPDYGLPIPRPDLRCTTPPLPLNLTDSLSDLKYT